ncbi:MAG: hypothetical protein ABFS21_12640 [Actinomycetota bacterium]
MTDRAATVDTAPISWPKAAVGAALFVGMMIVLLVVLPSLLIGPDPSGSSKVLTIVYVAIVLALLTWPIAAWQNHEPAASAPAIEKVSAFGRPMRGGPGFASFEARAASGPRNQTAVEVVDTEPVEGASSFGRPIRKGAK